MPVLQLSHNNRYDVLIINDSYQPTKFFSRLSDQSHVVRNENDLEMPSKPLATYIRLFFLDLINRIKQFVKMVWGHIYWLAYGNSNQSQQNSIRFSNPLPPMLRSENLNQLWLSFQTFGNHRKDTNGYFPSTQKSKKSHLVSMNFTDNLRDVRIEAQPLISSLSSSINYGRNLRRKNMNPINNSNSAAAGAVVDSDEGFEVVPTDAQNRAHIAAIAALEAKVRDLQETNKRLEARNKELEGLNKEQGTKIQKLEATNAAQNATIAAQDIRINDLETTVKAQAAQLQAQTTQLQAQTTQLQEQAAKIELILKQLALRESQQQASLVQSKELPNIEAKLKECLGLSDPLLPSGIREQVKTNCCGCPI